MDAHCRIEMFGGLRIVQGDRILSRFRTRKTAALLAYLAYHRAAAHTREMLADLFWPDDPPQAARSSLNMAVTSLRHQLEPPPLPGGTVLLSDRFTLQMHPTHVVTDVEQFEQALRVADRSSAAEHISRLETALELVKGPLLPEFYEAWIFPEQQRLQNRFQQATAALIPLLTNAGQNERALFWAQRALSADPFCEEACATLMRLLADRGQAGAALRCYENLEQGLSRELNAAPSSALRQFAQQFRSHTQSFDRAPAVSADISAASPPPMLLSAGTFTFVVILAEPNPSAIAARIETTAAEPPMGTLSPSPAVVREAEWERGCQAHGGQAFSGGEDAFCAAFARASDALAFALAAQGSAPSLQISENSSTPENRPVLRVALDTREVKRKEGEAREQALDLARSLAAAANAGQIVCSEQTAMLLQRLPTVNLRPHCIGQYQFRSLACPERAYAILHSMQPSRDALPLCAPTAGGSLLPPLLTRFYGREAELQQLTALLRPSPISASLHTPSQYPAPIDCLVDYSVQPQGTRLLTLTGTGGHGKTRLALEYARAAGVVWRGAICFVALADVSAGAQIPIAIRDALGLPSGMELEPREQIASMLTLQPYLLILDNFEHLVDGGAEIVAEMLARIPSLTCLITSRHRLNIYGERELTLAPLPVPEKEDKEKRRRGDKEIGDNRPETIEKQPLIVNPQSSIHNSGVHSRSGKDMSTILSSLLDCPSVQLFVDRAQAVRPDFQLTIANQESVTALCRGLEGIPLAIELAAARAQILTPAQMLNHLSQRFDLLTARARDVSRRHRTLRAAIDWSYQLLSPAQQQVFAQLAVFRNGWTLEAAQAVCTDVLADCQESLEQLRDASLITATQHVEAIRFGMLETLREYGLERLSDTEREAVQQRHAAYYADLAEAGNAAAQGPEQTIWQRILDTEQENLRAALNWCQATSENAISAERTLQSVKHSLRLRLSGALWPQWHLHGELKEAQARLEAALTPIPAEFSRPYACALTGIGQTMRGLGDLEQAQRWFEQLHAVSLQADNQDGIAQALNGLGLVAQSRGEYRQAQQWHEQALAIRRAQQSAWYVAGALSSLAIDLSRLGQVEEAQRLREESLALFRAHGDKRNATVLVYNLGFSAKHRGDYDRAEQLWQESIALVTETGDEWTRAYVLHSLGTLYIRNLKNHDKAAFLLAESLHLSRKVGDKPMVGHCLSSQADLAMEQERYADTERLYIEAIRVRHATENHSDVAVDLEGLAMPLWKRGQTRRAAVVLGAVEALREACAFPFYTGEREFFDALLNSVRMELGEPLFSYAWNQGRAMTWEEAVAFVLASSTTP